MGARERSPGSRSLRVRGVPLRALPRAALQRFGFDIVREANRFLGFDEATVATYRAVKPYTMTSPERVAALCDAVRYVGAHGIGGDVVECGVWRGGSMMAVARTLQELGETRDLYLFDTFEGMPPPTVEDRDRHGRPAATYGHVFTDEGSDWDRAGIDEVRQALASTRYPMDRVHLVAGRVEETIPAAAPESIALLRLDTDWYASTKHELVHLFPRLAVGGVLIIDDYGHWQGARQAVDEYFRETGHRAMLHRIDYTGRIAVKQHP